MLVIVTHILLILIPFGVPFAVIWALLPSRHMPSRLRLNLRLVMGVIAFLALDAGITRALCPSDEQRDEWFTLLLTADVILVFTTIGAGLARPLRARGWVMAFALGLGFVDVLAVVLGKTGVVPWSF